MAREKPITIWNVAALAIVVCGGAATLLTAHLWLEHWANTGIHLPVAQRTHIHLPAGETLAFYESTVTAPTGLVKLHIISPSGERIEPRPQDDDQNFKLRGSGLSGRALWRLHLPEEGVYDIGCYNANYLSDANIPAGDRVALFKQPGTLDAARLIRNGIHIVGATLTVLIGAGLYTLHAVTIHRRRRAAAARETF